MASSVYTHVLVEQFPLEVEQEPPVAEVEVRVVAVRVHQLVQLAVQDLDQRPDTTMVKLRSIQDQFSNCVRLRSETWEVILMKTETASDVNQYF